MLDKRSLQLKIQQTTDAAVDITALVLSREAYASGPTPEARSRDVTAVYERTTDDHDTAWGMAPALLRAFGGYHSGRGGEG